MSTTRLRSQAMLLVFLAAASILGSVLTPVRPAGAAATSAWARSAGGWIHHSSPTVADVNGDGVDDVIQTGRFGKVWVFDGNTGADMPGWPRDLLPWYPLQGSASMSDSTVSVADINNDGQNELVVSLVGGDCNSSARAQRNGGIIAFRSNGEFLWRWSTPNRYDYCAGALDSGRPDGIIASPALGDVNGDGIKDVIFGAWDHMLHGLSGADGSEIPGFPIEMRDTVWSSPALYDTDGDGRMEIFTGGDVAGAYPGGIFRSFTWRNGYLYSLWPLKHIDEVIWSSPSIGDIDGDGRLEAVVATGHYWQGVSKTPAAIADSKRVYAWHLDDGSLVSGWPRDMNGFSWGSPALGDLDGDGRPEVVQGSDGGTVYAWKGNGQLLWQAGGLGPMSADSMVIGDTDGKAGEEVVVADGYGLNILNGRTGAVQEKPGPAGAHFNSAAIGKVGNTWKIISGHMLTLGSDPDTTGKWEVRAWTIPNPTKAPSWPQFHKNARHIGADPTDKPSVGQSPQFTQRILDQSVSANQAYRLWVQDDGNVTVTRNWDTEYPPVWAAGVRATNPRLIMQSDGNLVLYGDAGVVWATNTAGFPNARLIMQNDGTLVIYAADGRAIWDRYGLRPPAPTPPPPPPPSPEKQIGSGLNSGQCGASGNGAYQLCMQTDGNLVKYGGGRAMWATNTFAPGSYFRVQSDGNMVIYTPSGGVVWASGTYGNPGATLWMQNDGNLVLYNSAGQAVWVR